jgi:hypothetical protein
MILSADLDQTKHGVSLSIAKSMHRFLAGYGISCVRMAQITERFEVPYIE